MTSLVENLEGAFTSGDFSLDTFIESLRDAASGVAPQGVSLDQGALGQIGQSLQQADFGAIGSTVTDVLGKASGAAGSLPQADGLLAPLKKTLATAETFANADPHALRALFEQAAAKGDGSVGLSSLAAPLAALQSVRTDPLVAAGLGLVNAAVPGGLPLDRTIAELGRQSPGVTALATLVGALMSTEALTREIAAATATIGTTLDGPAADAALGTLEAAGRSELGALIAAAAPDDPDQVAAVVPAVTQFADSIRIAADRLVTGMAFGEATLVGADLSTVGAGVTQASQLLSESLLDPVHGLATRAAGWAEPLLSVELGTPAASLDAFIAEITGLVGQLSSAIAAIDPAAVARPVGTALGAVLTPLHELDAAAHQVTAAIRSALQTAQQVIASIDLRPVTNAIHSALQPVVDALHELEQLIAATQEGLSKLAGTVTDALGTLKKAFDTAKTALDAAIGGVSDAVQKLDLDKLQATIQSELGGVANALHSAQVQPYFDTATGALHTAKSIVAAVPLSLLPDDMRQELDDAVAPIKAIDFDADVRDVLKNRLEAILTALDTSILDEVQEAYQKVVEFLQGIDPRPRLQKFEHDDFDPMLERIRAIDPTEILAPVADVIAKIKATVAGIDIGRDVLSPLEKAFSELEDGFAKLDPSTLLQPLEQQVGQLRSQIARALALDQWQTRLQSIDAFVTGLLDRLDFDALVALLDAAWSELEPAPDPPGTSALATVVSGLLEGTGLNLRMDSLGAVTAWIRGADASAQITARLSAAADAVNGALTVVQRVDPQALVAATQPAYTAVSDAVRTLPEGSLLREQLEPVLAGASPLDVLGATVDNRTRYLASLTALQTLLAGLAGSARSELTAIARGLREALRPLTVIPDRVRALFTRIGVDVTGKSLRALVRELLEAVPPSRLLARLAPAVVALKDKLAALVRTVVVAPLSDALKTVSDAVAALDISFIRTGLEAVHKQIADDIHALRPSVLLADVLGAFDAAKTKLAGFDPLSPVRDAINKMKALIDEVAQNYRPTVLLAPVLSTYDAVVKALGTLDVKTLLDPILKALDDIKTQLENGLDSTAAALKDLQAALP